MELKLEIICKNFEQKKIIDNKICTNEQSEEYYIIPLNKNFEMEYDDEVFKLTFKNQLLWLKYSNHFKNILIKEYDFNECVLIKSEDIEDIYVKLYTKKDCFLKNVWHGRNSISLNKKYLNKHMLVLPVIENMIHINEVGEGDVLYQIELITNEVLLKKVKKRSECNGHVLLTNNVLLNKDALFVELSDDEVSLFVDF